MFRRALHRILNVRMFTEEADQIRDKTFYLAGLKDPFQKLEGTDIVISIAEGQISGLSDDLKQYQK